MGPLSVRDQRTAFAAPFDLPPRSHYVDGRFANAVGGRHAGDSVVSNVNRQLMIPMEKTLGRPQDDRDYPANNGVQIRFLLPADK